MTDIKLYSELYSDEMVTILDTLELYASELYSDEMVTILDTLELYAHM